MGLADNRKQGAVKDGDFRGVPGNLVAYTRLDVIGILKWGNLFSATVNCRRAKNIPPM